MAGIDIGRAQSHSAPFLGQAMAYDDTTQACVTEAANQGAVGVIVSSGADEVSAAAAALISVGRFQMKPLPKWSKHHSRGWRMRARGETGGLGGRAR